MKIQNNYAQFQFNTSFFQANQSQAASQANFFQSSFALSSFQYCAPQKAPSLPRSTPAYTPAPQAKPQMLSYPKVGIIGNTRPEPQASKTVESRVIGSETNRTNIHTKGGNPWTHNAGNKDERIAVWWALQKNGNVRYDADRKQFFTTDSQGGRKDVASLQDVLNVVRQNGGVAPGNGKAFNAVGNFVDNAVKTKGQPTAPASPRAQSSAPQVWSGPSQNAQPTWQNPQRFIQQILQQVLQQLRF